MLRAVSHAKFKVTGSEWWWAGSKLGDLKASKAYTRDANLNSINARGGRF